MATLNGGPVVNFEDLFDFSPEPLDGGPPSNESPQVEPQQQIPTAAGNDHHRRGRGEEQRDSQDTFLDLLGKTKQKKTIIIPTFSSEVELYLWVLSNLHWLGGGEKSGMDSETKL